MYFITPHERMVLNSVQSLNVSIHDIQEDTNISLMSLKAILESLMTKSIIDCDAGSYKLSKYISDEQIKLIKDRTSLKVEKSLLLRSMIDTDEKEIFMKFYLNKKDEVIFKGMIENLKLFIQGAKTNAPSTKDEKIFFCGLESYGELISKL